MGQETKKNQKDESGFTPEQEGKSKLVGNQTIKTKQKEKRRDRHYYFVSSIY